MRIRIADSDTFINAKRVKPIEGAKSFKPRKLGGGAF